MNIENIISEGLKNKPDFTDKFTERVEIIKAELEKRLDAKNLIFHDDDMNYSSSQCLEIYTDININLVNQIDAIDSLKIFVSSRCPLYSYLFYRKEDYNSWAFVQNLSGFDELLNRINRCMVDYNFILLPNSYKDMVINGFYTELDGKAATYFEVLFSEIG